ncbi:MAG: hypothetical protein M1825_004631 [Sarcosagium campestre]|nr:MAG: hypothetical protein M1825_004631 [Sarcosagium campestre]
MSLLFTSCILGRDGPPVFKLMLQVATTLVVFSCLASATTHPVHHRLAPQPPPAGRLEKRASGKPLKVTNLCDDLIYPAIMTQGGHGPDVQGFGLKSGSSRSLTVGADWQGRVWGRTNCSFNVYGTGASTNGGLNGGGQACTTGDCNGIVDCMVSGETPVTLAEFTLAAPSGQTFYDISLVDGYNLPIAIVLLDAGDSRIADIPPNLTNPVCIATSSELAPSGYNPYSSLATSLLGTNGSYPLPFDQDATTQQLSRWCPWNLQQNPPSKPGDGVFPYPDDNIERPSFDPCYSACAKDNAPSDCCTGEYNSPLTCKPNLYSKNAKAVCPDAYSFAYDDQTSTFIVPEGGGFEVVFCPGGRSTTILSTMSAQLFALAATGKANQGAARNVSNRVPSRAHSYKSTVPQYLTLAFPILVALEAGGF